MDIHFRNIGLMGRIGNELVKQSLQQIFDYLQKHNLHTIIEIETAAEIANPNLQTTSLRQLGELCDLIIVVGGDGCLLSAARALAPYGTPLLGVNRGRLGFLTDILPSEMEIQLEKILTGHYKIEPHFLLSCEIKRKGRPLGQGDALNDIVIHPGKAVQMIEFELYIEGEFVYSQRSDGLIVCTPTGSTAYSLSAGGSIMHPSLDALSITPMCPHTLSSRPILINGNSEVKIVMGTYKGESPQVSCDGQAGIPIETDDIVYIRKKPQKLQLVHPLQHNFYEVCRSKLGWGSKL